LRENFSRHESARNPFTQRRHISPQDTVEEAMRLMTEKRIRHLPVLEDERLVGLVSIGGHGQLDHFGANRGH